jgi:hypothetical protein
MRPRVMDVQQPDAPVANQMCAAFRCPLRGTISPSNGLGTTYYCRFHYGKEPKENDEVTAKINQYRELIEAAETLRYGHRTFDQIAKRFGWDELCAGIQKNVRGDDIDERIATGYHYGRVMAALVKEIKRGVSGMQEQERGMGGSVQHSLSGLSNLDSIVRALQNRQKANGRKDAPEMGAD